MGLKNSLNKVGDVIEHIIYSNRDIGFLRAKKSDVYTHTGGKASIFLETDMGQRMIPTLSSSDPTIATIDKDGYVYGHSQGTATVSIECASLSVSATAHVGNEVRDTSSLPEQDRVIDEIAIINPRESLEEGDEYALYAVGISNTLSPKYDVGYYNPIKWYSSDPSVAGVTFGTLTAFKPGSCTITASDLNNNASASFSLTVTAKYEPSATDAQTYVPSIDNTGETDATVAIAEALTYAENNGYKKISFPKGTYKMSGDNRPSASPIDFPSNMIIDFNGAEIQFDPTATVATTGYTMFRIDNKENIWLRNLNVVGENGSLVTLIKKEGDRTLQISGDSKNIHIENCSFKWSPGFNVGISFSMRNRSGFPPNTRTPGSVEAGGLDAQGNDTTASGTWRTTYKSWAFSNGCWLLGFFQGFQATTMRSRIYDMYYYDSNKTLLGRRTNCYVYQKYYLPEGVHPSYCRIVFYQTDEPTSYDGDFYGFVHICDNPNPQDIYFKNCVFQNAISTGLSPQGGVHVVVDGCTFIDNGYQDPFSHIDWEDGRQSGQGCIVKNCTFIKEQLTASYNCQIINGYCRNVTFHDNYVENCSFNSGSESTMQRCFNNIFKNTSISISGKMDSVFAGNLYTTTPTINNPDVEGTHTISVDNEIIT